MSSVLKLVQEKMELAQSKKNSENPFEVSKYAFLDYMTQSELEKVLTLYFPIIKLTWRTYMIGLERHAILPRDDRIFIKTLVGYISLDTIINLDTLDDCLVLAKTINDLLKPLKQVVVLHLQGHKASREVISKYEESSRLN